MPVTVSQLVASGIAPTQANLYVEPLNDALARFDIDTPQRIAAFLGQMMVESSCFCHMEENLYYSDPARIFAVFPSHFHNAAEAVPYAKNPPKLGARVYASRLGNGDESSGDGYTFRGRSPIMLTGKSGYLDAGTALGKNYVQQPDSVASPSDCFLVAAWFWHTNKLNFLADANNISAITKAVNGPAMLQAGLRQQYTTQVFGALQ